MGLSCFKDLLCFITAEHFKMTVGKSTTKDGQNLHNRLVNSIYKNFTYVTEIT